MDIASGRAIRALDLPRVQVYLYYCSPQFISSTTLVANWHGSLPTSWDSSSCNVSIKWFVLDTCAAPLAVGLYKITAEVNKRNVRERSLLLLSDYHYRIPAPGAGKTSPPVMIGFWSSFSLVDQKMLRGFLANHKAHQCKTNATAIYFIASFLN